MPSADCSDGPLPGPAHHLDCRGLLCPLPVLETRKALEGLAPGEILRVIATDPAAEIDMAAFAATSGHALLARHREADELIFFFRRA